MTQTVQHPALPLLKEKFPGIGLRAGEFRGMVTVLVPREHLLDVSRFLRDDPRLKFDMLVDLLSIDYLGYPGATDRFGVVYLLSSTSLNHRLTLKVMLNPTGQAAPTSPLRDEEAIEKGDPGLKIPSVYPIWPVADWLEREQYDLMGILFTGHPDLRRLMTWNGFGSHPLRKNYPVRGLGEREDYKVVTRESA